MDERRTVVRRHVSTRSIDARGPAGRGVRWVIGAAMVASAFVLACAREDAAVGSAGVGDGAVPGASAVGAIENPSAADAANDAVRTMPTTAPSIAAPMPSPAPPLLPPALRSSAAPPSPSRSACVDRGSARAADGAVRSCYPYLCTAGQCGTRCRDRAECAGSQTPGELERGGGWPLEWVLSKCVPMPPEKVHGREP